MLGLLLKLGPGPGGLASVKRIHSFRVADRKLRHMMLEVKSGVRHSRAVLQGLSDTAVVCSPPILNLSVQFRSFPKQLMLTAPVQAKRREAKRRGELM